MQQHWVFKVCDDYWIKVEGKEDPIGPFTEQEAIAKIADFHFENQPLDTPDFLQDIPKIILTSPSGLFSTKYNDTSRIVPGKQSKGYYFKD